MIDRYAAMRRAAGLPPIASDNSSIVLGPAPAVSAPGHVPAQTARPKYMTPRQAAQILYDGMRLSGRPFVRAANLTGSTISWRVSRRGWNTVLWFTAADYFPGLIRLRNDLQGGIPRGVWPLPLPERREFKLTFHYSEITAEICEPLFAFCLAAVEENTLLGWPLFEHEPTYPQYAWTRKAKAFYEANKV